MTLLQQAAIYLGAAIVAVPLFNRLGFGSILGYLVAGVAIGPWVLGLVGDVDHIFHFAELGVVLLLFLIGLELQPSRLWVLRRSIFGLGAAQVLVTSIALAAAGWWLLDLTVPVALVAGLGLSLSSTAFVVQLLAEKKQLTTLSGRSAFAILLFQDLAVVPMLALSRLGLSEAQARLTVDAFRRYDEEALVRQHAIHQDEKMMIQNVKDAARELEALFESDIKSQGQSESKKAGA